jgi:hypothetical protein
MNTDTDEKPAASLFARLISRQRRLRITVGVSLLLILASISVAYLDGVLDDFLSQGYWRLLLLPPAVIIYILVVSPIMARMEAGVIEAFRSLVLMDDDRFDRLVNEVSRLNPIGEVIAFGVGAAFGLWNGRTWLSNDDAFWLKLYLPLSTSLMFGLLGWTIYAVVTGTRLTAELHRQPLRVDIFDIKPFEPIGRQSLMAALVFVGGIALSMVFGLRQGSIFAWQNWLIYALLALVSVLVFFLNMRDTHRVLAAEKERELEAVQRNIRLASRTLMGRIAASESTGTLGADIGALIAYEERLRAARTWPYDTAMLRTLFLSIIVPGGVALAPVVFETLSK